MQQIATDVVHNKCKSKSLSKSAFNDPDLKVTALIIKANNCLHNFDTFMAAKKNCIFSFVTTHKMWSNYILEIM